MLYHAMPCHAISQPIRSIFIDTGNIIDFLSCYLYTFDVCEHNRMDSVVRCLLLCAPSFISFIRFNLSWMGDTWKMKNDCVYRISFDNARLTPFCLLIYCFTHHILFNWAAFVCSSWLLFSLSFHFCKSTSFRTQFHVSFIDISPFSFPTTLEFTSTLSLGCAQMWSHTHSFFFFFLHFISSLCSLVSRSQPLWPRDQSIRVWRMVDQRVNWFSFLLQLRNATSTYGMAWPGCIVNLFIRIHPFDMLINVQCLHVARTRHVLYRSFIRLSDECTYEYVRFKLKYETALFLFLQWIRPRVWAVLYAILCVCVATK